MPNSYSRRSRSNNSTFALLSTPPLAPAPQVEGRLVTPGGVGQHSPAQGGHHSIAKPDGLPTVSTYTIWRTLREAGLSWQRSRTWCATGTVVRRRRHGGAVPVTDDDAAAKKS